MLLLFVIISIHNRQLSAFLLPLYSAAQLPSSNLGQLLLHIFLEPFHTFCQLALLPLRPLLTLFHFLLKQNHCI